MTGTEAIRSLVGTPYVYLGGDPKVGLDCITLAALVYEIIGEDTKQPELWRFPMPIGYTLDTLERIELERWHEHWEVVSPGRFGSVIEFSDHIGIYIGSGEFIHCQARKGVIISRVTTLNILKPDWLRLKVQLAAERS